MHDTTTERRTDTQPNSTSGYEARVNRDGDGNPLGAAMFLSGEELRELGIDPTDTDHIAYSITDGQLRVVGGDSTTNTDGGETGE